MSAASIAHQQETLHGIHLRHRRPAECRQVGALQCAHRNRRGAGDQISVQHHRGAGRRGCGTRPAARCARQACQVGKDRADAAHLCGYCRPGARRLARRGAWQPVSGQHPRGRRHRARGALLRGRGCHPRRGPHRSDRRYRDDRDRADARRPRKPGAPRRGIGKAHARQRQGGAGRQGGARPGRAGAGAAARRQAGAAAHAHEGGGEAVPHARPAHVYSGALRLQRRGSLRRRRRCVVPQDRGARAGRGRGLRCDLGENRG